MDLAALSALLARAHVRAATGKVRDLIASVSNVAARGEVALSVAHGNRGSVSGLARQEHGNANNVKHTSDRECHCEKMNQHKKVSSKGCVQRNQFSDVVWVYKCVEQFTRNAQ